MKISQIPCLLLVIVIVFTACSCKQQCQYGNAEQRAFFEFDKIDYYHCNISDTDADLIDRTTFGLKHPLLDTFLESKEPKNIAYPDLGKKLQEAGYIKKNIPQSCYPTFDSMFREHCVNSIASVYSREIYRDVLVFSKGGKTTGVAKICYDVTGWDYKIVGTDRNISAFGQGGDIYRLKELLYGLK